MQLLLGVDTLRSVSASDIHFTNPVCPIHSSFVSLAGGCSRLTLPLVPFLFLPSLALALALVVAAVPSLCTRAPQLCKVVMYLPKASSVASQAASLLSPLRSQRPLPSFSFQANPSNREGTLDLVRSYSLLLHFGALLTSSRPIEKHTISQPNFPLLHLCIFASIPHSFYCSRIRTATAPAAPALLPHFASSNPSSSVTPLRPRPLLTPRRRYRF